MYDDSLGFSAFEILEILHRLTKTTAKVLNSKEVYIIKIYLEQKRNPH